MENNDLHTGKQNCNHRITSVPFSKTVTPVKPSCQSDSVLGQRHPAGLTAGTGLPHPLSLLEEGPARSAPLLVFPARQGQQSRTIDGSAGRKGRCFPCAGKSTNQW